MIIKLSMIMLMVMIIMESGAGQFLQFNVSILAITHLPHP